MASSATIATGRSWTRLHGVDLLRGLAIFFVLMNHVNMRLFLAKVPYTHGLPHQLVSSLFWNGQFGVQIFFAISGFLITSTSLRRWGSLARVRVRDFYLLRFARIGPLLLSLLLVLSALHLAGLSDFVVGSKTGGLGRALVAALTFHVNVLEARRGYLPGNWDVLWSLSVEEMFYLFFPVLCWLFGRTKLLVPLLCTFVVLGPFARTVFAHGNEVWQEYSYLGGMDAIALGCLTALINQKTHYARRTLAIFSAIGSALLVLILCFSTWVENSWLGSAGLDMSILAFGTCLLITVAAQTGWRGPLILHPLLNLGQRSYEIYLTHMFVVFAFFRIFVQAGEPLRAVPLLFCAVIVFAAILGDLTGRFFSEPLNRSLRKKWGDGPDRLGSVIETDATAAPRTSNF
jgi:peptidoglycan/LPS O-acetylase OafA/YrhL